MLRSKIESTQGMTLLELMIVVMIVSLLTTIAQTSYKRMVIRAKLAEGKALLSYLYTSEAIYKSEYNSYSTRFDALGFVIEGKQNVDLGFSTDFPPPASAPQGLSTCTSTCGIYPNGSMPVCNFPVSWQCTKSSRCGLDGVLFSSHSSTASATRFMAEIHVHFNECTDSVDAYTFTINQNKRIISHPPN